MQVSPGPCDSPAVVRRSAIYPVLDCSAGDACASRPGVNSPEPPHHGQTTVWGEPPSAELTRPVPRQGVHFDRSEPARAASPFAATVTA
jgi:hypothetical protein